MNENPQDIVENSVVSEDGDASRRQNSIPAEIGMSGVQRATREALGVDDNDDNDPLEVVGCGWGSDRCM